MFLAAPVAWEAFMDVDADGKAVDRGVDSAYADADTDKLLQIRSTLAVFSVVTVSPKSNATVTRKRGWAPRPFVESWLNRLTNNGSGVDEHVRACWAISSWPRTGERGTSPPKEVRFERGPAPSVGLDANSDSM